MKKEPIKNNPLVSIITPLFNAEKFILQTLASVQQQSYSFWEHIIVDDASSDDSVKLVEEQILNDSRIKLIKLSENLGAAHCRNHATKEATGKYIAFLDSDDFWHPEKLTKQITFMESHQCNVSFTSYVHIDENGELLRKRIKALSKLSYQKQHRNNYIGNLTGMYNAQILGKIEAPSIRKRQDWAVWLEAIKKSGEPALGLPEDLAFYRVRSNSISSNKFNLIPYNYKFYQHLGYSWPISVWHLLRFFWEYFLVRPKQIEKY